MAKAPRTELSGKEARYILQQNHINQSWLSEQLGIKPQSLVSRLNATVFKKGYQMDINRVLGKRIFDVDVDITDADKDGNHIPVLDLRTAAGFEYAPLEDNLAGGEMQVAQTKAPSPPEQDIGPPTAGEPRTENPCAPIELRQQPPRLSYPRRGC